MAKAERTHLVANLPGTSPVDRTEFDPTEHPDARPLVGYVKESPHSKSLQLFVSQDHGNYLEIPLADVLYMKKYGVGEAPKTVVWIEPSAVIREVHVPREIEAWFLNGEITAHYLPQAGMYPILTVAIHTTVDPSVTCKTVCLRCLVPGELP